MGFGRMSGGRAPEPGECDQGFQMGKTFFCLAPLPGPPTTLEGIH